MVHSTIHGLKVSLLAAAVIASLTENSDAKEGSMICENFRREYSVKYDTDEGTFVTSAEEGETAYTVKSVSIIEEGAIIKGTTVGGGPSFEAHTYGRKKIRYLVDFELIQIDFCK